MARSTPHRAKSRTMTEHWDVTKDMSPDIHGKLAVKRTRCRLCPRVEVEMLRIIKKIAQRNETKHPGEDQSEEDQPGDRVHQDSPESVH